MPKDPQEFHKTEVIKVDEELGLVFGFAIVCKVDGEDYFDLQQDHIPEDAMLKAAADFMTHSRAAKEMHSGKQIGNIVFAFPLTGEIARAMEIITKHTGLLVAMKPSPAVLAKFKSGEYSGFSIGGKRVTDEDFESLDKAGGGNPNHDERGRFAEGPGGGGSGEPSSKAKKVIRQFDRSKGNFADNLHDMAVEDIQSQFELSATDAQHVYDHVARATGGK